MNIMMLRVTPDGKPAGEASLPSKARGGKLGPLFAGWRLDDLEESSEIRQSEVFIDTFPEQRSPTRFPPMVDSATVEP